MDERVTAVIAVGLIVLLFAFAIPTITDATEREQTSTVVLQEGETYNVTERLQISVNNTTEVDAEYIITDRETGETQTIDVPEDTTKQYSLQERGNITNTDSTAEQTNVTVGYAATYGWDPAAKTLASNIKFILILMVFVVVAGGMKVVIQ